MGIKKYNTININDNCFDMIRLICAGTVFLGHFITHFHIDSSLLHTLAYLVRGVPVFFMLSGFFIAASLDKYSVKEFYTRRFFRIYPSLWVCVSFNFLIILFTYTPPPHVKDVFGYFFTQFTVLQFYTGDWLARYGVGVPNGVLWTISADIQFYIIAVLLVKIMKKQSEKIWFLTIGSLALLSLGLEMWKNKIPSIFNKLLSVAVFPSFLYIFLFGMMAYYYKDKYIPILAKHWKGICALYCVWSLAVPAEIRGVFEGIRYNVVTTLLLMCMTISLGFAFGRKRMNRDYSYGFYLYHMVVINFIYHLFIREISTVSMFLMVITITIICTALLGYVLQIKFDEKLSRIWQNRISSR